MFTPEDRAHIRAALLERAAADPQITGVAITGSAAADREDRWSDIDLAFGVADPACIPGVLADWTAHLYERHRALHHCDLLAGAWTYRVFLLPGTLQVDLAFVFSGEFRALAPSFRLVSGISSEPRHAPPPPTALLAGMGWLYALHARSALARGLWWQAEYMISGIRDHGLMLACVRHGLPAAHARGIDRLPAEVTALFLDSLVGRLEPPELHRAFAAAVGALSREIHYADQALARRLEPSFADLAVGPSPTPG